MIKSEIFTNKDDIKKVLSGLRETAQVVSSTYGYSGHDIAIRYQDHTLFTNDGVTVANHIFYDDPLLDMGADIIRKSTANADLIGEDGTTATAILVNGLAEYLEDIMNDEKIDNIKVREGMELAKKDITNYLKSIKKDIDIKDKKQIYNIAYTSTRDEYLSNLLTEIFLKIGKDGKAIFKEYEGNKPEVEYQDGFNLSYGYSSSMFPNVFKNGVSIVVYNERINNIEAFQKMFSALIKNKVKNVCFFIKDGCADLITQQVASVQQQTQFSNINIITIQGSETKVTKELKDLCIITGSTLIDNNSVNLDDLYSKFGKAEEIRITDKETIIVGGKYNKDIYNKHLEEIQKEYNENRNDKDRENIQKRIANLQGVVAVIKVGGLSRERINNYKDKLRDGIGSIKNAMNNGVLPGGGVALFDTYRSLLDNTKKIDDNNIFTGYDMVLVNLKEPISKILENSNKDKTDILDDLFNNYKDYSGYDAKNDIIIDNMIDKGIVDPYDTIINSLYNAIDNCELFLNLGGIVTVKSEVFNNE